MANDYISQITLPNSNIYEIRDSVSFSRGIEYIRGTWSAASGTWTGVSQDTELYDGKQIILYMPFAGSGNATLNLTLNGGTAINGTVPTTGAKNVYFESTTRFTTHKGQNSQLHLIYHEALKLSNGTTYQGWWYVANRDTTTTNATQIQFNGSVKAKEAIVAANIIVAGSDGLYFHLKKGSAFDISQPILYASGAFAANEVKSHVYSEINFTVTTTQSISLTSYKPVFIKGTLAGTTFTPISTTPLTQTVPTEVETPAYVYIYLGYAYSSTAIRLQPHHPIYWFKDGKFQLYSGASEYALNAAVATSWATATTIYTNLASSGTTSTLIGGESSAVALQVNGTLGTNNGGLGNNSFTANRLLYSESATKFSSTSDIYASTGAITINGTSAPANSGKFQVKGTSTMQKILPQADATYDLGETATRWNSLYLDTSLLVGAKSTIAAYDTNTKGSFVGSGVISVCINSVNSTAGDHGYYIMAKSQQYARMYVNTLGTTGATGIACLELGNNKNGASTKVADNARGALRLYSDSTNYTVIYSQMIKDSNNNIIDKAFYLPAYGGSGSMFATHVGSNNAVGSSTQPVYVAAGGRITVSNGTVGDNYTPTFLNAGTTEIVFPVQYKTFTIASDATGTTLSSPAYNSATDGIDSSAMDIFVLTIVVNQNDISHLNAPIEWSTDTNNQIVLYTDVATSGSVSGYILTARGCEAPPDVSS